MKVELIKDKDGYTAKVAGHKHLFAFGYTKKEALEELVGVAESELETEKEIRKIEKRVQEYLHKIDSDG
jgi:predicted RNase H-like HicB family nuclease